MTAIVQRSFAGGIISPALRRRVDLERFGASAKGLTNVFVRKGGGVSNRSGTTVVYGPSGNISPSIWENAGPPIGADTILVPWDAAGSSDAYVLEFGNGFIRFTKNGSLVTVDTVSDWSSATSYVVGDLANYQGANYYCILAHSNQQPPNATYWYALSGFEYSIPTPYTTTLLQDRGAFSFTQDTDRMLITHSSKLPYELVRTADTTWTLTAWPVDSSSPTRYGLPRINAPTNLAHNGADGVQRIYVVSAITTDLEESLPSSSVGVNAVPTTGAPITLSWTASTFATGQTGTIKGYNIYQEQSGKYFLQGFSTTNSYVDNGDPTASTDADSPFESRTELNTTAGTFPKKCGTFQQRTILGNFSFNVQACYAGRIGFRQNFTRRFPAGADDSILFQLRGKKISGVRHFVDIGDLLVFADSGEWIVEGDNNGAITPTAAFPKQFGHNGANGNVWPIVVGSEAIYVQERGSIVRALGFDSQSGGKNGFRDSDLTAFCEHLFQGFEIVSMAYQKTPHSILWCVRDDGKMLGLTYIKDQQILAWHLHETDGTIEDVCSIPEGQEHALYMIVKRTINGLTVRMMERMVNREFEEIEDAIFLDCALTYDGRNTGSQTMTLTGGTNWDETEELTCTSSEVFFSELEIGNEIWFTGDDEVVYRCEITEFTSDKIVTVVPVQTIPSASGLRDTATTDWARAVDTLSNLDHLEGEEVSVFANGYVVANPNNSQYGDAITVDEGSITLPGCYTVIHVGLPYFSDIETLDVDSAGGETMMDKNKLVTAVIMDVENTRGVWAGPKPPEDDDDDPLEDLIAVKARNEEGYDAPISLNSETAEVNIASEWNSNGRVFIRQVDPLPMTILSITPCGLFPLRGAS